MAVLQGAYAVLNARALLRLRAAKTQ
jgi:hypothetical protein